MHHPRTHSLPQNRQEQTSNADALWSDLHEQNVSFHKVCSAIFGVKQKNSACDNCDLQYADPDFEPFQLESLAPVGGGNQGTQNKLKLKAEVVVGQHKQQQLHQNKQQGGRCNAPVGFYGETDLEDGKLDPEWVNRLVSTSIASVYRISQESRQLADSCCDQSGEPVRLLSQTNKLAHPQYKHRR